jgi:hypothetical protein
MVRKKVRKPFSTGMDKPKLDPNDPKLKEFAEGAKTRSVAAEPPAPPKAKAAKSLDPKAKPSKTLTLRLNEYQIELLRKVAELESRSIQKTVVWHLVPLLEEKAEAN